MTRFYPDSLPPYPLEPSTEDFAILDLGAVGQGVVTLKPFHQGEVLFVFSGFLTTEISQFTLQVSKGVHIHDPFFMGKVLHSCDPNTYCDMERRMFTALRPIASGECITMDYMQTETELFKSFVCNCGADHCRKVIGVEDTVHVSGHHEKQKRRT